MGAGGARTRAACGAPEKSCGGQERKLSRLWAPPLCAKIPYCFAPSATVGESGVFFCFSFTGSPLQAGLPGTPPEQPKARRAAPFPWESPNDLSPGRRSRRELANCKVATFLGEGGRGGRSIFLLEFLFDSQKL